MSDLAACTLEDCISLLIDHRGRTPKKLGGEFTKTGIAVISAKNVKDGRLSMSNDARYVPPDLYERWMPQRLRAGDVLLTSEAPLGEAAFLKEEVDYCLGQRLFALRADETRISPRFLYYLLRSSRARHALEARATGTTAQGIRQAELVKVELEIPSLPYQRGVAALLGSLDDKIDLNRRMNETLEDVARAIFKSWFVDFEPVRAKATGGVASPGGAFPERLVPSELGDIPEGWTIRALDQLVSISREAVDPRESSTKLYDHYSIPAFDDGQWPIRQPGEEIRSNKFLVRPDCVLLSRLNPRIPRVWLPSPDPKLVSICSTEFAVLHARAPYTTEFVYALVSSARFQEDLMALVTGTSGSHQRVKPSDLQRMMVLIPPARLVGRFTDVVGPILRKVTLNRAESQMLGSLRDALLPRLVSGEVQLKEAERVVDKAV